MATETDPVSPLTVKCIGTRRQCDLSFFSDSAPARDHSAQLQKLDVEGKASVFKIAMGGAEGHFINIY